MEIIIDDQLMTELNEEIAVEYIGGLEATTFIVPDEETPVIAPTKVEDKSRDWNPNLNTDPLIECDAKFGRFKKLCNDIDAENEWIIYLTKDVNLKLFLFTIRGKLMLNPRMTIEDVYKDILLTSKLDDEIVGSKRRDHVKQFIAYFMTIVKSMD